MGRLLAEVLSLMVTCSEVLLLRIREMVAFWKRFALEMRLWGLERFARRHAFGLSLVVWAAARKASEVEEYRKELASGM